MNCSRRMPWRNHDVFVLFVFSFLVFSCSGKKPDRIIVEKKPPEKLFRLKQTHISIRTADFLESSMIDDDGYQRIDFTRFDPENQGEVIHRHSAVVMENPYIRLTILPERGKPYSLIYKVTGHEEFFLPTVAHLHRSPNRLGWWYMLGGIEYTLPDEEHGDTWATTWEWRIVEDSPRKKTVRMRVHERIHGLIETVDISIYPDKAYYEADIHIENPTSRDVQFQHWINPMWAPGGDGELTPNTEFIIPTNEVYATERPMNDWMLEYHPDRKRLQSYTDNPMRFLNGWKRSGDLLAWKLEEGFYSAFCHEHNEGIVRVFPKEVNPGCNIWTWGAEPSSKQRLLFSVHPDRGGYVEMWGGITHGFDNFYTLDPEESVHWKEWMYPYTSTNGLHHATEKYAVTFFREDDGDYILRLCPSGEIQDVRCRILSSSSGRSFREIEYRSIYPAQDIPSFQVKGGGEMLVCEITAGNDTIEIPARQIPIP